MILRDAYFFLDQGHVARYYEGQHKGLKGWYSGVVSFSREEAGPLYVFISEMLYEHVDALALFLKIFYQMLMYLRADFVKLKYKKLKKGFGAIFERTFPRSST